VDKLKVSQKLLDNLNTAGYPVVQGKRGPEIDVPKGWTAKAIPDGYQIFDEDGFRRATVTSECISKTPEAQATLPKKAPMSNSFNI
jgi:hypothetical protein